MKESGKFRAHNFFRTDMTDVHLKRKQIEVEGIGQAYKEIDKAYREFESVGIKEREVRASVHFYNRDTGKSRSTGYIYNTKDVKLFTRINNGADKLNPNKEVTHINLIPFGDKEKIHKGIVINFKRK